MKKHKLEKSTIISIVSLVLVIIVIFYSIYTTSQLKKEVKLSNDTLKQELLDKEERNNNQMEHKQKNNDAKTVSIKNIYKNNINYNLPPSGKGNINIDSLKSKLENKDNVNKDNNFLDEKWSTKFNDTYKSIMSKYDSHQKSTFFNDLNSWIESEEKKITTQIKNFKNKF